MPDATAWVFDDFELDVEGFELRQAGRPVAMEPQVFEVLAYLVTHHGRLVSKDELIGAVWRDGFASDGVLATRVMSARKAIGDTGADQRLIQTVRGRGYRFAGAVQERTSAHAPPETAPQQVAPFPLPSPPLLPGTPGLQEVATSFIGRRVELARLEQMLGRPGCRLVTVVGPGGVGKTRLVVELVRRLRESGREVVTAALEPVDSDHDLRTVVAGALGLGLANPEAATIAARIGQRDVVLVLDNFEQLVERGVDTVATLVTGAPALRVVVTSREVLGLREEWIVPLAGLTYSDDEQTGDAIELFLEREAQAGAVLDDLLEPDAAVREICRLVDGMPLALELAAALRRYRTREEIARLIAQDVGILRSEFRNVPERHRTIPGLFAESCRHLDEAQLQSLLVLSVFEGSFTLDAAEVVGASAAAVRDLVDRSLVEARGRRFALHPLLRQYARDRVGHGYGELQRKHGEYFAGFLAGRGTSLAGGRQLEASAEIDGELPNVVAFWRWASASGRMDLLAAATPALFLYAHIRARWPELREPIEQAVAAAEAAGEEHWRTLGSLMVFQTWARIRTSPGPEVMDAYRRADQLFREHDELPAPGLASDTAAISAILSWAAGQYDRMMATAEEARRRASGRGDRLGEAYALWLGAVGRNRLARVRWVAAQGRGGYYVPASPEQEAILREAGWYLDRATVLLSAQGEQWFRSYILFERALNAKALGDPPSAVRLARESYELRAEFGDARGRSDALLDLAGSYVDQLNSDDAEACCREVEAIVRKLGDPGGIAELDRAKAQVCWLKREYESALQCARRAGELSLRIGSVNNVLGSIRLMADVFAETGERAAAAEIYEVVAAHPASPPFSRARAESGLDSVGDALSVADATRARAMPLPEFAAMCFGTNAW